MGFEVKGLLKFTPLEFETIGFFVCICHRAELKFTPLEFETAPA